MEKSSDTNLPHGQFHGRVRIERFLGTVKTVNALDRDAWYGDGSVKGLEYNSMLRMNCLKEPDGI